MEKVWVNNFKLCEVKPPISGQHCRVQKKLCLLAQGWSILHLGYSILFFAWLIIYYEEKKNWFILNWLIILSKLIFYWGKQGQQCGLVIMTWQALTLSTWDQNLRCQLRKAGIHHLGIRLICSWHGAMTVSLCLRGIPVVEVQGSRVKGLICTSFKPLEVWFEIVD